MSDRIVFRVALVALGFILGLLVSEQRARSEVHVVAHTISAHNKSGRNNENWGAGLLYRQADWVAGIGNYYNSHNEQSQYLIAGWQPHLTKEIRLGAGVGLARGYPAINQGRWFPAGGVVATYQANRLGINLLIAPPANSQSAGVAHMFISWRL